MMQLKYTILYVEDVSRSIEFYEKAFGLKRGMMLDTGDYGELKTGETTLSFSSRQLMTDLGKSPGIPNVKAPTFEVAFETDNVTAAVERAKSAGATVIQDVREEPWGQTTAYVSDIDGYLVEICSPVSHAK